MNLPYTSAKVKKILGTNYSEKLIQQFTVVCDEEKLTLDEIKALVKKGALNKDNIDKAIWTISDEVILDEDLEEI